MKKETIENKLHCLGLGFIKVPSSTQVMTELTGGVLTIVSGGATSGGSTSSGTASSSGAASSGGSRATRVGSSKR